MLEGNQVVISWSANTEPDFRGYSVFRGNNTFDEFSLISKGMLPDTMLLDTLPAGLMNPYLYYYVVAYDNRLNASPVLDTLKILRPDIIPPATPLIKYYAATDSTVVLQLVGSSSEDISYHYIARTNLHTKLTDTLAYFSPNAANAYTYVDTTALPGLPYRYEFVALDRAGLRNTDSSAIETALFDQGSLPPIKDISLEYINEQLHFFWNYATPVDKFIVYRAKGENEPLVEFKYLPGITKKYIENQTQPNTLYRYALMAIFKDGKNTRQSKVLSYLSPSTQP